MRYFPHSSKSLAQMLSTLEKVSLSDLFRSIPGEDRLSGPLKVPAPLGELALKRRLAKYQSANNLTSFLGAGATEHFSPEWVSQQLLRSEWYTSYTPYQPEASQGTLQAIFEFQSITASLLGLDVANASMYDGATALLEALLMAVRVTKKSTLLVSKAIHPEYRETLRTYLETAKIKLVEFDLDQKGRSDLSYAQNYLIENKADIAAIAIQTPNFFGQLEDITSFSNLAHNHNALLVSSSAECLAFGAIDSPGNQGADIATAEALGLLGALNLGGPGLGLFACKKSLIRQLPGRIVGRSVDKNNKPGFTLTLSTREQHIRREKATSNICTNHNLMALAFTMNLCAYGESGFSRLARTNIAKTLFFREQLAKNNCDIAFDGSHFNETVVRFKSENELKRKNDLAQIRGIIPGVALSKFYPHLAGHMLVSTTELHDDDAIKQLAELFGENL